jgi:hypothetical protein
MRKVYGQSSIAACPFCGGASYAKNGQGVAVCMKHKDLNLPDLKCVCGGWLDIREGKFGTFYTCMKCGAINQQKMMLVNADAIRAIAARSMTTVATITANAQRPASQGGSYMKGGTIRDRVQQKIARGEPLTPDELDFI